MLKNLCADILLGGDFQIQHKRVIFEYNGPKHEFVISRATSCNVTAANVEPSRLFANLTPNCHPIATKSRRFNVDDKVFIKDEICKLEESGVIRPSSSSWRAQVLVVRNEETGKKRLCVDYSRTINLFTNLDAYPLPRIDDLVNNLATYKVFSTFDLKSAYHQIPIDEAEKPYTAFEANGKLYEFNRIPFGVTNGVPQFQRKMQEIVEDEKLCGTFPYLDNITIGGRNQQEHDKNVNSFLNAIKKRNFTLNESKTVSSVSEIKILGYCVGNGTLRPDPEKLQPLKQLPPPRSMQSLKRVLGLFAYYAKWIPNFSKKTQQLKISKQFSLKSDVLKDFEDLKNDIATATLASIDEKLPFVVECDASDRTISATLNQSGRPVAFISLQDFPINRWEYVLPDVMHSLRSLLCTANNATPHELFFKFNRRSTCGTSLPTWLLEPGPVLLRNFTRTSKNDDLVKEVELLSANPTYAHVRYPDGREASVSLRDLSACPRQNLDPYGIDSVTTNDDENELDHSKPEINGENNDVSQPADDSNNEPFSPNLRRSTRANKGVPPVRYGEPISF